MYGVGAAHAAALFCLEPEPTQYGRSQSWLRDLGLPELDGTGDGQKSGSSATLPKSQNYFSDHSKKMFGLVMGWTEEHNQEKNI